MRANRSWGVALALLVTAGCQTFNRAPRAVPMTPAAALDDTPRPKAVSAPRGQAGDGLSTAQTVLPKQLSGSEEATYEYPITAPKETIAAPKIELPPAPSMTPAGAAPHTTPGAAQTPLPGALPADLPAAPAASPVHMPLAPGLPASSTLPVVPPAPSSTMPTAAPAAPAPSPQTNANPPITIIGALPTVGTAPSAALAAPVPIEPEPKTVEAKPTSLPKQDDASPLPMTPIGNGALVASLRSLRDKADQRYATMDSYILRIRRREVVGNKSRPEELILGKFRKAPFSIYLKWLGEEGKNREVCYVQGRYDDALHTLLAPGDMFLFGGKHMKFAPDHPMVRSNCRYPIAQAGLGPLIASFGRLVDSVEKKDGREGTAKYLGKVKRPEFEAPVEGVVQNLPAKYDPLFPNGGQRYWFFDTKLDLPVLIVALDHQGKEVEYYCHDRIQAPANLEDDEFNPYKLWKAAAK